MFFFLAVTHTLTYALSSLFFNSPGRFLAAIQVKMLIAHILVEYDFKFEDGKGVPPERRAALFSAPGNTNILFRKRQK